MNPLNSPSLGRPWYHKSTSHPAKIHARNNHDLSQISMYLSTTLDPSHLNLNFFTYKRFDVNKINAKYSYLIHTKRKRMSSILLGCLSLLLLMLSPRHVESSYIHFYIIKRRDMTITMCIICCARTFFSFFMLSTYFMCIKDCLISFIYLSNSV
jgi:hypothetical protein